MQASGKVKTALKNDLIKLGARAIRHTKLDYFSFGNFLLVILFYTTLMAHIAAKQKKRNVNLPTKRTSLVLDSYYWAQIDMILAREALSLDMLIQEIELRRKPLSLAAASRLFVVMYMSCRLETQSAQAISNQASNMLDSEAIPMLGESGVKTPTDLFQALSLLGRYAAQAA